MDIEKLLFLTMEGEVIRSLLAGNDTLCFSTGQYDEAVDAWIAKTVGATRQSLGIDRCPLELSRKQLQSIGLVAEVGPDVWTLKTTLLEAASP